MDLLGNLVEISSKLSAIQEFCEFSADFHKLSGCEKPDCEILKFFSQCEKSFSIFKKIKTLGDIFSSVSV